MKLLGATRSGTPGGGAVDTTAEVEEDDEDNGEVEDEGEG
jgi:hypothetical protein